MWDKKISLLGLGWCALWSASVFADDSVTPTGNGSEVTPSLLVQGIYRTNVYLQEGEAGGGQPTIPGFQLTAHPALDIRMDDSSMAHLDLSAGYTARKFLTEGLGNLDRYNDFDFSTTVNIAPEGSIGLTVKDDFAMIGYETEAVYADTAYIQRMGNDLRGWLHFRPGPAFDLRGGGIFQYEDYKNDSGTSELSTPNLNTRMAYGPTGSLDWKFIPQTSLVINYQYSWFYWRDNFVVTQGDGLVSATDDLGDRIGIPNGTTSQFTMGLRGRFTRRLVLGATAGVTSMVYDEESVLLDASDDGIDGASTDIDPESQGFGADVRVRCTEEDQYCDGFPSSLTGMLDVNYELNDDNTFGISYRRDFQDVFFTNYVAYHQVSVGFDLLMWNRLGVSSSFSYRFEDYEGEVDRSDHLFRARLDSNLSVNDSISFLLGSWWTQRASHSTADGGSPNGAIEFDDIRVHAGLNIAY